MDNGLGEIANLLHELFSCELAPRITSYNVCYTKLLRSLITPELTNNPEAKVDSSQSDGNGTVVWLMIVGLATGGLFLLFISTRKTKGE